MKKFISGLTPVISTISIALYVVLAAAGLICAGRVVELGIGVPITIKKSGQVIYSGNSACINVKSAGTATRVDISGGFLCLYPERYFVGNDVSAE